MSTLFINYRRKDASGYAGRLYDRLAKHFDRDQVFMDIDQIEPGEDFHDVIDKTLKSVQVAVVLIGQHWLDITDAAGKRRLDNADDWVRLEIAALLERNIRVIPVLVGGAVMPQSTQLPDCLKPLARRNAYEISDTRFHTDADKLIQVLEKIMGVQSPSPVQPAQNEVELKDSTDQTRSNVSEQNVIHHAHKAEPKSSNKLALILGIVGIVIGAIVLYNIFNQDLEETEWNTLVNESRPEILAAKETKADQTNETTFSFEPEMVHIPAGTFLMGSTETEEGRRDREGPQRDVTIAAFEMSRFEITVHQFREFVRETNYRTTAEKNGKGCHVYTGDGWEQQPEHNWQNPGFDQTANHPVVCVSWDDAQAYVHWLSQHTEKQYRLPTEAEWEYAARAKTRTARFYADDKQCDYANGAGQETRAIAGSGWTLAECSDSYVYTAPVGQFKPNPFDLFDVIGNVWEWTEDCWHDNYTNAPTDGSAWLKADDGDCNRRVVRGGSWDFSPQDLRSAVRGRDDSDGAVGGLGFRIARGF